MRANITVDHSGGAIPSCHDRMRATSHVPAPPINGRIVLAEDVVAGPIHHYTARSSQPAFTSGLGASADIEYPQCDRLFSSQRAQLPQVQLLWLEVGYTGRGKGEG
jgi:hypothetical protein